MVCAKNVLPVGLFNGFHGTCRTLARSVDGNREPGAWIGVRGWLVVVVALVRQLVAFFGNSVGCHACKITEHHIL
jgi:hypothetical protein